MKKNYTLFIDSGIGGLSTLAETYKLLHHELIYYSDNANCPYGQRSKKEIFEILKNIILEVRKSHNIDTVVLACNTATTSAIKPLRNAFGDLKFIGTEPAVKLAKTMGSKNILVLCTPATAKQKKYLKLAHQTKAKIHTLKMPCLAFALETFFSAPSIFAWVKILKQLYFSRAKFKNIDGVVLGCTHYVLIRGTFQKIFNLPVFDGNFGVAKQVLLARTKNETPKISFFDNIRKSKYSSISPLNFDNYHASMPNSIENDIIFMFSREDSVIKEKYIKTFMQILANN